MLPKPLEAWIQSRRGVVFVQPWHSFQVVKVALMDFTATLVDSSLNYIQHIFLAEAVMVWCENLCFDDLWLSPFSLRGESLLHMVLKVSLDFQEIQLIACDITYIYTNNNNWFPSMLDSVKCFYQSSVTWLESCIKKLDLLLESGRI